MPDYKQNVDPMLHWIGWSRLRLRDAIRSTTQALRLYSRNNRQYKITSRRKYTRCGGCKWKVRSHGKLIGYIMVTNPGAHMIDGYYRVRLGSESKALQHWKSAYKDKKGKYRKNPSDKLLADILKAVKLKIDTDHHVGTVWHKRELPDSTLARKVWINIYEAVKEYHIEEARTRPHHDAETQCKPTLDETLEHLRYKQLPPIVLSHWPFTSRSTSLVDKSTLKKIIKAGDDGLLDNALPK